jgi:hypothetical protein
VAQVGFHLVGLERLEVIAPGDALGQLPEVAAVQHLAQLGLADQDDLQQFLLGGLEVGEQPDLLQHVGPEVLRLVDDQHVAPRRAPRAGRVQRIDQRLEAAVGGHLDVQFVADGEQELVRESRGFSTSATSACSGSCSSRLRTSVVLPVPTSPVSWMKPPLSVMP